MPFRRCCWNADIFQRMKTLTAARPRHAVAMLGLVVLGPVSVTVAPACSGEGAGRAASDTTSTTPAATSVTTNDSMISRATFAPALSIDLGTMTRSPRGVFYKDLATGTGAAVDSGSTVSIHYAGNLVDGTPFDANQAPRPPFSFTVRTGEVIPGFDEGVMGMRAGGRRQVIIPSELGYGAAGIGPIPPHAILVFTIEVVDIR